MTAPFPFTAKKQFRYLLEFIGKENKLDSDGLEELAAYGGPTVPADVIAEYRPQLPLGTDTFLALINDVKQKSGAASYDAITWGFVRGFARHQLFDSTDSPTALKPLRAVVDETVKRVKNEPELTKLWQKHCGTGGTATVDALVSLLQEIQMELPLIDWLRALVPKSGKKPPPPSATSSASLPTGPATTVAPPPPPPPPPPPRPQVAKAASHPPPPPPPPTAKNAPPPPPTNATTRGGATSQSASPSPPPAPAPAVSKGAPPPPPSSPPIPQASSTSVVAAPLAAAAPPLVRPAPVAAAPVAPPPASAVATPGADAPSADGGNAAAIPSPKQRHRGQSTAAAPPLSPNTAPVGDVQLAIPPSNGSFDAPSLSLLDGGVTATATGGTNGSFAFRRAADSVITAARRSAGGGLASVSVDGPPKTNASVTCRLEPDPLPAGVVALVRELDDRRVQLARQLEEEAAELVASRGTVDVLQARLDALRQRHAAGAALSVDQLHLQLEAGIERLLADAADLQQVVRTHAAHSAVAQATDAERARLALALQTRSPSTAAASVTNPLATLEDSSSMRVDALLDAVRSKERELMDKEALLSKLRSMEQEEAKLTAALQQQQRQQPPQLEMPTTSPGTVKTRPTTTTTTMQDDAGEGNAVPTNRGQKPAPLEDKEHGRAASADNDEALMMATQRERYRGEAPFLLRSAAASGSAGGGAHSVWWPQGATTSNTRERPSNGPHSAGSSAKKLTRASAEEVAASFRKPGNGAPPWYR